MNVGALTMDDNTKIATYYSIVRWECMTVSQIIPHLIELLILFHLPHTAFLVLLLL